MSWNKTDTVAQKHFNHRGMGGLLIAGQVCRTANQLLPDFAKAISFYRGTLHIEIPQSDSLTFKLIEGKFLSDLNLLTSTKSLPSVRKVRLTFQEESVRI